MPCPISAALDITLAVPSWFILAIAEYRRYSLICMPMAIPMPFLLEPLTSTGTFHPLHLSFQCAASAALFIHSRKLLKSRPTTPHLIGPGLCSNWSCDSPKTSRRVAALVPYL